MSTSARCIGTFWTDIQYFQMMQHYEFDDPQTFPLVQSLGWHLGLWMKFLDNFWKDCFEIYFRCLCPSKDELKQLQWSLSSLHVAAPSMFVSYFVLSNIMPLTSTVLSIILTSAQGFQESFIATVSLLSLFIIINLKQKNSFFCLLSQPAHSVLDSVWIYVTSFLMKWMATLDLRDSFSPAPAKWVDKTYIGM